jgi:hypothetical protein
MELSLIFKRGEREEVGTKINKEKEEKEKKIHKKKEKWEHFKVEKERTIDQIGVQCKQTFRNN